MNPNFTITLFEHDVLGRKTHDSCFLNEQKKVEKMSTGHVYKAAIFCLNALLMRCFKPWRPSIYFKN